ncbi:hypothetical protein K466DRAFT_578516 [Polyporus arcularius HHB13444]|uniref:Uncharacterized protein n=1 Tax=Polyporus arcularius HHB13444 TaxID=1314778 RepID=A0A5C3NW48_9APHY|nr:hypothetical protein K466DRAFT_578516 [Polyporus arcularius HHB13444]
MQESLDWWRENPLRIREGDIPYESAVRALGTSDAPVELRKQNSSRWTLYVRDTDQVAVLSYAAIFSMADDYYSGNLIPTGQPLPEDLPSERIERFATWKCQYAYAFDTAYDKTLFNLQQMLEEYASSLPGFNPTGLPRREYQSGNDLAYTWRYWMRAPMFIRINEGEVRPPPPPHLHPWVIAAEKRSRIYRANPGRPRVFSFDGEVISSIENSDPDLLQRGDIVLVHFVVSIVFTPSAWYTELIPVELVRVVPVLRLTSDALESGPPTIDVAARPALMDGERIGGTLIII